MSHPYPHHILIVPVAGRSHVRLISQLAFNVLSIHPSTCLTFFMTQEGNSMLEEDISLQGRKWAKQNEGRYRVVVRGEPLNGAPPSAKVRQMGEVFPAFWDEVVQKAKGGERGDGEGFHKMPCLVIMDVFGSSIRKFIETPGSKVQILTFQCSSTLASHSMIRPTAEGGVLPDMKSRYLNYKEEGMGSDEAAMKAYRNVNNRLWHFPDLPPMYDSPQTLARNIDESTIMFMDALYQAFGFAKGGIYLAVPELESEGIKDLARTSNGPIFGVGPQVNESVWLKSEESSESKPEFDAIFSFLDKAQEKYGENGAAYISFGTAFWPTNRPEVYEWIIESLLTHDPPIPFVFATAMKDGKISDEWKKKVEESGRGMVVDWCPQVRVLQHPAVGMFLTHCGNGSLTESIICGVPMITLPFGADQPAQSAFYCGKHKCGYDLRELKTGFAGLPLGDGYVVEGTKEAAIAELHSVWDKLRGENGREVRENVQNMKRIWHKSWTDGESRKAVESLSQFFH